MSHRALAQVLTLALMSACAADAPRQGTQVGDEGVESGWGCQEVSREPLDDPSGVVDGFMMSPDEAWSAAEGSFAGPLSLDAGGEVALSLVVEATGSWELVQTETPSMNGAEPAIFCGDYYARSASVVILAEGHLDEVLEVEVQHDASGITSWTASIDLDDLGGDARPARLEPASLDRVWLSLAAHQDYAGPGWSGDASFLGEAQSGEVVSLQNDPYGTFSTLPTED